MHRTHRKRIVPTKMNGKLLFEIFKGIKFLSSIKIFVILSMRSFHLTVMSWGKRANKFMSYS